MHDATTDQRGEPRRAAWTLALLSLALLAAGCRSPHHGFTTGLLPSEPDSGVLLQPGDEIEIKFYHISRLDEIQTILPDGTISLQLIGDVKAEGMKPAELGKALYDRYTQVVEKADLTVIARKLHHRAVYVGGAVANGGRVEMPGRLTAFQAILEAGGFDMVNAEPASVIVVRQVDGRACGQLIDMRNALKGKAHDAFVLRPQDVVYVSRTRVSDANVWIEQHLNRMVPAFGFTFLRRSGANTYGYDMSR